MPKKLNPHHRVVGDAANRQSEFLVEIAEDGLPSAIRGEILTFNVAPQYSTISANIHGGGQYEDRTLQNYIITITYLVGSDGGYWEQIETDKLNGNKRYLSLVSSTRDARSLRLNGGRAVRYNDCHMLEHTDYENSDSSATSFRTGQATFYAPADAKVVLQQFRPVF